MLAHPGQRLLTRPDSNETLGAESVIKLPRLAIVMSTTICWVLSPPRESNLGVLLGTPTQVHTQKGPFHRDLFPSLEPAIFLRNQQRMRLT